MQRNVQLRGQWGEALRAARALNKDAKNGRLNVTEQRQFDNTMAQAESLKSEFEAIEAAEY